MTEAGPAVLDELYDVLMKQVSYLVKDPKPAHEMVTHSQLVKDSLNVLLGVPSVSFALDKVRVFWFSFVCIINCLSSFFQYVLFIKTAGPGCLAVHCCVFMMLSLSGGHRLNSC